MARSERPRWCLALAEVVFWIHFAIFISIPGLFLVPERVWPDRVTFHFWFVASAFVLLFVWGGIWTLRLRDKVYLTCFLDTLTQWLRGYDVYDPRNYNHSFTDEIFARFTLRGLSKQSVPYALFGCVALAAGWYLLKGAR